MSSSRVPHGRGGETSLFMQEIFVILSFGGCLMKKRKKKR